ncbi:MAG: PEGA domain-containing protein [Polyangiaceae bacterium]|nr:PEGA domain-containing protein [Polyangiaceae bacterium]
MIRQLSQRFAVSSLCIALAVGGLAGSAHAQDTDRAKQEARERFDRGLRLFNTGDTTGALAEFERAYEVTQHPLVLFNIALVQQSMRSPVQAVDSLNKLLANPGQLDAERLTRARTILAEQLALIGFIHITTEHKDATVEIDNIQVATTPVDKPIAVPSGNHVVSVILPGFYPLRQQVTVAGKSTVEVAAALRPLEGRLAHLEVQSTLGAATVRVNGEVVGETPLAASLALPPGQHTIELSRDGYVKQSQVVTLGDGANGRLSFDLQVDQGALGANSGFLELAISEDQAVIFVDGRPQGTYRSALQLPKGSHRLRVERANFFPYERTIVVPAGMPTRLNVELQPTTEYRAAYADKTNSQRTWGWVSVGAGAAFMAGSTGFLVWNNAEENDAQDKFDAIAARGNCRDRMDVSQDVCITEVNLALGHVQDAQARTKFGWIGLGTGAAITGLGAFLLLSNDDPNRYEPKPESDVFGGVTASPVAWASPGNWGAGVRGTF